MGLSLAMPRPETLMVGNLSYTYIHTYIQIYINKLKYIHIYIHKYCTYKHTCNIYYVHTYIHTYMREYVAYIQWTCWNSSSSSIITDTAVSLAGWVRNRLPTQQYRLVWLVGQQPGRRISPVRILPSKAILPWVLYSICIYIQQSVICVCTVCAKNKQNAYFNHSSSPISISMYDMLI